MTRKSFGLVVVLLAIPAVWAGNAGAEQPTANAGAGSPALAQASKPGARPPAGKAKPPAAAATPRAAPAGALTSALSNFGEDALDPMLGGTSNYQALIYPMFEQLVGDDGKGHLRPLLAESWSLSADGKVWTFKVRKGIKFHNGDELTSADAKFSMERLSSAKSRTSIAPILRPVIDRIEAPDPATLLVITKEVTAILPELLTGGLVVMPKKYIEEKGEAHFAEHPVGTGPWKFVQHEAGASLELEVVAGHWRITPAFQKLLIKLVPEQSTRIAMLRRGEADIVDISPDATDEIHAAGLQTRALNDVSQPVLYVAGTYLQGGLPTQDPRVRRALSLAIDREDLSKNFFKGHAKPAARVKMAAYSQGWDPSWKPEAYNPPKAVQLLAEAGYPAKFRDPVVNLWSYQAPGASWMPQLIQIVAGYWEAVGVKTKITPIDFGAMRALYRAKPIDPKLPGSVYPFNERAQPFPLMSIVNAFGSAGVNSLLRDPAWDDLYLKVLGERSERERLNLTRQLMNQGHDHYACLVTANVEQLYAVGNRVGQWQALVPYIGQVYEAVQHR
jgi:peptide/nickel transport system substrate-binding protein